MYELKQRKKGRTNLCYQDQSSSLRVSHTFCPVGTKFSKDHIDLGIKFNSRIKGTDKTKNEILQLANQYANRGTKVVFSITVTNLKESWK